MKRGNLPETTGCRVRFALQILRERSGWRSAGGRMTLLLRFFLVMTASIGCERVVLLSNCHGSIPKTCPCMLRSAPERRNEIRGIF